jgi:hypothetical protein
MPPPPPPELLLLPPQHPLLLMPSSQLFTTSCKQNLIGGCMSSSSSSITPSYLSRLHRPLLGRGPPKEFLPFVILTGTHSPKNTNIWWCDGKTTHRFLGQNLASLISRFRAPVTPPPKNVDQLISKYIDHYTKDLFLTTNLL